MGWFARAFSSPEELFSQGLQHYNRQEYAKAYPLFEAAARRGHPESAHNCGVMHNLGQGRQENKEAAFTWFDKSAELGYGQAQLAAGYMLSEGIGTKQDDEKAVWRYMQAAEQGVIAAQTQLGLWHYDGIKVEQDEEEAFYWFEQAAEQEDENAAFMLACQYLDGRGVAKNEETAYDWFLFAAEKGHPNAQCFCGLLCEEGTGTKKDTAQALLWYEKAAENHDETAIECFGKLVLKENEFHRPSDLEKALKYAKTLPEDEGLLARLEERQRLYNADTQKLEELIQRANAGDAEALNKVGLMHSRGQGTPVDKRIALKYYRKAAELGFRVAQYNCGNFYKNGWGGIEPDESEAEKWYVKAAIQGHPASQYECGRLAEKREPRSLDYSIYWYTQAAENGDKRGYTPLLTMIAGEDELQAEAYEQAIQLLDKLNDADREQLAPKLKECLQIARRRQRYLLDLLHFALEGDRDAQYSYGSMLEYGKGTRAAKDAALLWYEKAARQGNAEAAYRAALLLEKYNVYPRIHDEMLVLAAEAENADAQFRLGMRAYAEYKDDEALYWFKKAAHSGHIEAQYYCGLLLSSGIKWMTYIFDGINYSIHYPRTPSLYFFNESESLYWFERAAGQEHIPSAIICARLYEDEGAPSPADPEKSFAWYTFCAERGDVYALYKCVQIYEKGQLGLPIDPAKAHYWCKKWALTGDAYAQFQYAEYFRNGYGIAIDILEAENWYVRSYANGHPLAAFTCGLMYVQNKKYKEAQHWFETAANDGGPAAPVAMYNLAVIYHTGGVFGEYQDESLALEWMEKSAALGYKDAQNALAEWGYA